MKYIYLVVSVLAGFISIIECWILANSGNDFGMIAILRRVYENIPWWGWMLIGSVNWLMFLNEKIEVIAP